MTDEEAIRTALKVIYDGFCCGGNIKRDGYLMLLSAVQTILENCETELKRKEE